MFTLDSFRQTVLYEITLILYFFSQVHWTKRATFDQTGIAESLFILVEYRTKETKLWTTQRFIGAQKLKKYRSLTINQQKTDRGLNKLHILGCCLP